MPLALFVVTWLVYCVSAVRVRFAWIVCTKWQILTNQAIFSWENRICLTLVRRLFQMFFLSQQKKIGRLNASFQQSFVAFAQYWHSGFQFATGTYLNLYCKSLFRVDCFHNDVKTVLLSRNLHFNYPTQTRTLSELQIVRQRSERFRGVSKPQKSEIGYFGKWARAKRDNQEVARLASHFLQHRLPHFSRGQSIKLSYLAFVVSLCMVAGWDTSLLCPNFLFLVHPTSFSLLQISKFQAKLFRG